MIKTFLALSSIVMSNSLLATDLVVHNQIYSSQDSVEHCAILDHGQEMDTWVIRVCRVQKFTTSGESVSSSSSCYITAKDTKTYHGADDPQANRLYLELNQSKTEHLMKRSYCSSYQSPCTLLAQQIACEANTTLSFKFRFEKPISLFSYDNYGRDFMVILSNDWK